MSVPTDPQQYDPLLFSITQIERRYGIPVEEIRRALQSGDLRFRKVQRVRTGITADDLAAWLQRRSTAAGERS